MSILSKVLLGFVFIDSLVLFYMATRTLRTHQAWRSAYNAHQAEVDKLQTQVMTLQDGGGEPPISSMRQLETELHAVLFDRGRVWRNCVPQVDANTGAARVSIEFPDPHQIDDKSVLYVFDGAEPGTGSYLGEFRVVQVADKEVGLEPTLKPLPEQLRKIAASRAPWTLYDLMPRDGNDVFAGLPENELLALLPRQPVREMGETDDAFNNRLRAYTELINEFRQDGQPAAADTPPDRIAVTVKFTKDFEQLQPADRQKIDELKIPHEVVVNGQTATFDHDTALALTEMEAVQEVERRYRRRLRDYNFLFREYNRRLPVLLDRISAAQTRLQYADAAATEAKQDVVYREAEKAAVQKELARLQAELSSVVQYEQSLQQRLQAAQTLLTDLHQQNKRMTQQLAQFQNEALRRANPAASAQALPAPR